MLPYGTTGHIKLEWSCFAGLHTCGFIQMYCSVFFSAKDVKGLFIRHPVAISTEFSLCSLGCAQMRDGGEIAVHRERSLWLHLLVALSHFAFVIEHQFTAQRITCVPSAQAPLVCFFRFFFGSWAVVSLPSCVALKHYRMLRPVHLLFALIIFLWLSRKWGTMME